MLIVYLIQGKIIYLFRLRSSIVVLRKSIPSTALIWAHEIGHAFNLQHDFGLGRSPRYDEKHRPCSHINGKNLWHFYMIEVLSFK